MTSAQEEGDLGWHLPAPDLRIVYTRLLAYVQDKQSAPDTYLVITPDQLTSSWVASTGLQAPTLVQYDSSYREQLQDVLKPGQGSFDLSDLPKLLEANAHNLNAGSLMRTASLKAVARKFKVQDREVQTMDISRQAQGPKWTIRQWCLYWNDRQVEPFTGASPFLPLEGDSTQHPAGGQSQMRRQCSDVIAHLSAGGSGGREAGDEEDEADSAFVHQGAVDQFVQESAPRQGILASNKRRLISLSCLPISDTPLKTSLAPPEALVAGDLLKLLHQTSVFASFPFCHYLACHPAGAVLNFTLNKTGATSWCHVVTGRMLVVMIPPTTSNLSVYATWADKGPKNAGLLLADGCQGAVHIQVESGQSVIIPGGWPYCMAALEDTLLLGAQMLHINNLRLQFTAWEVEDLMSSSTRSMRHLGFPSFKHLMWHLAMHYGKTLRVATGMSKLPKVRVTTSKDPQGTMPTPTYSYSQAVALRRVQGGHKTDSTSAWAAGSVDDGDHAMSARKRKPPSTHDHDATPEHTLDLPGGSHARPGQYHGGAGPSTERGTARRTVVGDAASDDEADAVASSRAVGRLKRLRATDGRPGWIADAGSDGEGRYQPRPRLDGATAAGEQQHAMDVDEEVGEVDENMLSMPLSPAGSAGSGRPPGQTPGKQQESDGEVDQAGRAAVHDSRPVVAARQAAAPVVGGGGRFKVKIKAAGLPARLQEAAVVQAPVAQVAPQQQAGKGRAARRQKQEQEEEEEEEEEEDSDEEWHMGMSSDSAVLTMDSSEGGTGPARSKKPAKQKKASPAANPRASGRAQKQTAGPSRKKGKATEKKQGKKGRKGRSGGGGSDSDSDGSWDLGKEDEDDLSLDSDMGSEEVERPQRQRRRRRGGESDFDDDFGSDVQDTDPEDVGVASGGLEEAGGVRRSSRKAGAHGLTAAEMEQRAMQRREQEADAWDLLKQRSARGRALGSARRSTGGGASGVAGGQPAAAGGSTQLLAAVEGRRAAAAAAAWSDDDSDMAPLPALAPAPVATRSRPQTQPAARPQRNVKRRMWSEEDVFDSDEPDTEPDSEGFQSTPPSSPDVASRRGKRGSTGGALGSARQPGAAAVPTPSPAVTGVKVKLALGRGRGTPNTQPAVPGTSAMPSQAANDAGVTPAPRTGMKLKVKRPVVTPASFNIPQTDGAGDSDGEQMVAPQPPAAQQPAADPQQAAVPAGVQPEQEPQQPAAAPMQAAAPAGVQPELEPQQPDVAVSTPFNVQQHAESAAAGGQEARVVEQSVAQVDGASHGTHPPPLIVTSTDQRPGRLINSPSQLLMPPPPARPPAAQRMAAETGADAPAGLAPGLSDAAPTQAQGTLMQHRETAPQQAQPGQQMAGADGSTAGADQQQPASGAALVGTAEAAGGSQKQPSGAQQPKVAGAGRGGGRGAGQHTAASSRPKPAKNISDKAPDAAKIQAVAPLISLGDGRAKNKTAPSLKGSRLNKLGPHISAPPPLHGPAFIPAAPGPAGPAPTSHTAAGDTGVPGTAAAPAGVSEQQPVPLAAQPAADTATTAAPEPLSRQHSVGSVGHASSQPLQPDIPIPAGAAQAPPLISLPSTGATDLARRSVPTHDATQPPPHIAPSDAFLQAHHSNTQQADAQLLLPTTSLLAGIAAVSTQPRLTGPAPSGTTPLSALAAPPASAPTLTPWEAVDLPVLLGVLRHWHSEASVFEDLPFSLKDPVSLLDHLEEAVAVYLQGSAARIALDAVKEGLLPLRLQPLASADAALQGLPQPLPAALLLGMVSGGTGHLTSDPAQPMTAAVEEPGCAEGPVNGGAGATPPVSGVSSPRLGQGVDVARVRLIWPDMYGQPCQQPGVQLLRPKVSYAPTSQLPAAWRPALQYAQLPGASPCPSSVIVDMNIDDQVEVVGNNDDFLLEASAPLSAARVGTGLGLGAAAGRGGRGAGAGGVGTGTGLGQTRNRGGAQGRGAGAVSKKAAQWTKKLQQR